MSPLFRRGREAEPGKRGETLAAAFLQRKGCRVLRRNVRNRFGEIDLIVQDGDEVVFVEVKTRTSGRWGDPATAVTPHKRKRICLAAEQIATRGRLRGRPLRFDVITVLLGGEKPEIAHYPDAFTLR